MAEEKKVCPECTHKTKERSDKEYKDLINRLSRIEGQVRGIRKMVENNAYCTEIISEPASRMISARGKKRPLTSLWQRCRS